MKNWHISMDNPITFDNRCNIKQHRVQTIEENDTEEPRERKRSGQVKR